MTDTDDLIRAAVHELISAAPAPRSRDESVAAPPTHPMERTVPVSMNDRTSTRRPTPAALGAVAATLAVVGGIWYLTSDTTDTTDTAETTERAAALPPPTSSPERAPTSTVRPTTTVFAPPAVQRASIISPIAPGAAEISDDEVLVLAGDSVVAVDVGTARARSVAPAPGAARLVGLTGGAVVVEQCCDAELVVVSDDPTPVLTTELDFETGERAELPASGWRFAAIEPSGGRLAAVVGTDLVIASTTEENGTVRSLLERDDETDEPVFGTVIDLAWSADGGSLLLIEERADEAIVHRIGGSTGAHIARASVAELESVGGVEFAGFGSGGSIAVVVDPAGADGAEVRFFDQTTLLPVDRVDLPAGVDRVRSVDDGSLVWVEGGVVTIRRPNGELIDAPRP